MRVIATAGHVDHGKSALILALTGTDPDRFPEEKARGLTIDLGFAFADLPSGQVVGFVDVPGHARFVKNMLAGVGAVDIAVLVVAANEGWMAQTEEHVAILDLLDIDHGVVALTKADLVDDDTLELARLDIESQRPHWPVVAVDSLSGRGLDAFRVALDQVLRSTPAPRDRLRPRLWVDRVFAARGAGTVVTGTLVGGTLALGDDVVIEPGSRPARIRGIESRNEHLESAPPGSRVALNLAGIDHTAITRGDAVVLANHWEAVSTFDIALHLVPGHTLARRARVQAHLGSGETDARIRILDDGARFARVHLPAPLPLAPGDRVVLRSSARQTTVGGGEILDIAPARRTSDALARLDLPLGARLMRAAPWTTPEQLARAAGASDAADTIERDGDALRVGEWLVEPDELARVRARATAVVAADAGPGVALATLAHACGIDARRLRAALDGESAVVIDQDLARDASRVAIADDPAAVGLLAALAAHPFDPPAPATVDAPPALVRALVRAGRLVDLDGIMFHADAIDDARRRVAVAVLEHGSLTVSDVRNLLGSSRKFVVPIVNQLDADGITRRRGDERIPGPTAELFARE